MSENNGKCRECEMCDNKMLCVTADYYMHVNFANNLCFNFENKEFSRPQEIYRQLKTRYGNNDQSIRGIRGINITEKKISKNKMVSHWL